MNLHLQAQLNALKFGAGKFTWNGRGLTPGKSRRTYIDAQKHHNRRFCRLLRPVLFAVVFSKITELQKGVDFLQIANSTKINFVQDQLHEHVSEALHLKSLEGFYLLPV